MQAFPEIGDNVAFTAAVEESAVAELADFVGLGGAVDREDALPASCGHHLVRGALVVELVNSALRRLVGDGFALSCQDMRFPAAVTAGERVTVTAEVVGVGEDDGSVSARTRILRRDGEAVFHGVGQLRKLAPSC